MRSPVTPVYKFTRMCSSNADRGNALPLQINTASVSGRPQFSNGTSAGTNLALRFSLTTVDVYLNGLLSSSFDLPGFSDFTNLFEEYRLDKIDIMVLPTYANGQITTGAGAAQLPWIVYISDSTDNDAETSLEMIQRQNAKFTQLTNIGQHPPYLCSVYPKAQLVLSGSSTPEAPTHRYISTADASIPHYGFKMALDDSYNGYTTNTTICQLNIICRYHMSFRGVE